MAAVESGAGGARARASVGAPQTGAPGAAPYLANGGGGLRATKLSKCAGWYQYALVWGFREQMVCIAQTVGPGRWGAQRYRLIPRLTYVCKQGVNGGGGGIVVLHVHGNRTVLLPVCTLRAELHRGIRVLRLCLGTGFRSPSPEDLHNHQRRCPSALCC